MSDVAAARASLAAGLFRDTVYVLRTTVLDDGGGGTYPDPAGPIEYGPILGAFSRQSGRELVASSQVQQRGTYRLALPVATDVLATDQIIYQGMRYNVVFCPPLTALNLSRVVELEEAGRAFTQGELTDADGQTIFDADGQTVTDT